MIARVQRTGGRRRVPAPGALLTILPIALILGLLGAGACDPPVRVLLPPVDPAPRRIAPRTPGLEAVAAAWSPRGDRIAFVGVRDAPLYRLELITPTSGEASAVRIDFNEAGDLALARDGSVALTHSVANESGQVWRIPLDGGSPGPLALSPPRAARFVALDLDAAGTEIVGIDTGGAARALHLMDIDGRELARAGPIDDGMVAIARHPTRRLAAVGGRPAGGNVARVLLVALDGAAGDSLDLAGWQSISSLTFSPAGERLAVAGAAAGGNRLAVVADAGGGGGTWTERAVPGVTGVAWNAAGDSLSLVVAAPTGDEVALIDAALAGEPVIVTALGGDRQQTRQTVDGRLFATRRPGTQRDLWILDVETGDETQLSTDGLVAARRPAWSPDAGRIACVTRAGGSTALRLITLGDGGAVTVLVRERLLLGVDWSRDGGRLVVAASGASATDLLSVDPGGALLDSLAVPLGGVGALRLEASGERLRLAASTLVAGAERALVTVDLTRRTVTAIEVPGRQPADVDLSTRGDLAVSSLFEDGIWLAGRASDTLLRLGSPSGARPSFAPDGTALVYDWQGSLYRLPVITGVEP